MKMKFLRLIQFTAAITAASLSHTVSAADRLLLYGVDLGDESHYAYGGLILPFGENSSLDEEGWRARVWFYDMGYEYERSITQSDVDADASGLEIGAGKQWVGDNTRGSLYLSLAYRDTETSPLDHESEIEGGDAGLKLQGEVTHNFSENWMVQAMGSYTGGDDFDDVWVRMRAGYKGSKYTFGPEIIGLDGPDYDASRVGIFVDGFKLGSSTSANISVGAHDGSRGGDGGYLNIGFATQF